MKEIPDDATFIECKETWNRCGDERKEMSDTLKTLMHHWTQPIDEKEMSVIKLPFNLEEFCRDMDKRLAALKADNARMKKEIEDIFRAENGG